MKLQIVNHLADGLLRVGIGRLNVAKVNQLLQGLLGGHRILPQIGRMHPSLPGDVFPRGNPFDLRRRCKRLNERLAIHVFSNGQAEHRENGGDDIEQGTAVDAFIGEDTGAFEAENPMGAMPGGRVIEGAGAGAWPKMVAEESMIGKQE